MAKCVIRHLRFAWIEYQSSDDGVAFHHAMSSCTMGWRNIMLDLPRNKKGRRLDSAHPELKIAWRKYGDKRGLIVLPKKSDEINEFLGRWVFSPGVKMVSDSEAKLTIDSDASEMADLVAISGHGGGGIVLSFSRGGGWMDLNDSLKKFGGATHSDRLKYVLVPACANLGIVNAKVWLPAFSKTYPVRGILGYDDSYPGGKAGARIMERFVKKMKAGLTIMEAWKEAHGKAYAERWGVMIHPDAIGDTLEDWLAEKLKPLKSITAVKHFRHDTCDLGGLDISDKPPAYQALFHIDGLEVSEENNGLGYENIGLFPGEKGHILLKANKGGFVAGDKIRVVFYYYRPQKDGMNLEKLLKFDPALSERLKLMHLNTRDKTTFKDGFEYSFAEGESKEARIPFTVRTDAHRQYDREYATDTHGRFWVSIDYEKHGAPIYCYTDGIWLREPR